MGVRVEKAVELRMIVNLRLTLVFKHSATEQLMPKNATNMKQYPTWEAHSLFFLYVQSIKQTNITVHALRRFWDFKKIRKIYVSGTYYLKNHPLAST